MKFMNVYVQLSYKFHVRCHFIEIDDFGVIFRQKLANYDHVICAIGEGEVLVSSAKRRNRRNRVDLIDSTTPCHDGQVARPY